MIRAIAGYFVFLVASIFLAEKSSIKLNRNWKPVLFGILLQIMVAFALTNIPACISAIEWVARGVMKLKDATIEGTKFCFGYIGGGDLPFNVKENGKTFIFAFQALPSIILVSVLSAILMYFKILPFLSKVVGGVLKFVFNIKLYIGMFAITRIFIGPQENLFLIKNKLNNLTKSETFTILSLAFVTSSAGNMPVIANILSEVCPDALKHVITASILNIISVLILSRVAVPTEDSIVDERFDISEERKHTNLMGVISQGLSDGLNTWWRVVGSLIGVIALIYIINYTLALLPDYLSGGAITLQKLFGLVMYPFTWLMGIDAQNLYKVAQIIGTKIAVNETVAFSDLAKSSISQVDITKSIYAICNFGNFSTLGATISSMVALAPKNTWTSKVIGRAFICGFLATCLSTTLMSIVFDVSK